jgi:pilus assembly protein CpaC
VRAKIKTIIISFCVLACAVCVTPAIPAQNPAPTQQQPGVASQDSANELFVTVGQSVLVDTVQPIVRVAVGLGDIAEANVTSRTEVMVNGKAPGVTSLIVWESQGGRQFFKVVVRPSTAVGEDALDGVRRELRMELPGQHVKVNSEGGMIFVRGAVKDLNSSERAVQIASTAGKVVNLLYVDVPPAQPQILLKVRFASVDRNMEKQLGINIFSTGAGNTIGGTTTGQFSPPTVTLPSATTGPATALIGNALNIFLFRQDLNLGATIQALETQGVVEILAQPNIVAADGKQASFLAGGQYPYPVVQGIAGGVGGAVTIQFKDYGVRLNFIPTITPRNTIRLQVAPEVSSLDYTNAVTISGFTIPGIDIRTVKTEVELRDGQSFAIGGLIDNRESETFQKIPFIGDVPILGKFFQSKMTTRTNTELIVIVTPEIVAPIPASVPLPELNYPTKFMPPNSNIPMTNPGADVTGAKPLPAEPPTMPIEKLLESMKPETPLVIGTQGGGSGGGSASSGSSMSQ